MMAYSAKILADSMGPNGVRLTTWELTYPRFVHSEALTHRLFSRNSASSRAIPTKKLTQQILHDPAVPVWWGKNQPGMQARQELKGWELWVAQQLWLKLRYVAVAAVWLLSKVGLHKQIANRLLEPWMFITVIVTATEWDNWYALRTHPDAQPEIGWVAKKMKQLYLTSTPVDRRKGEWHLPLVEDVERSLLPIDQLRKLSVARCARVSYLTHDGRRSYEEDLQLHDRLLKAGHLSPFEHVAQAQAQDERRWSGNFQGWFQYRESQDPTFMKVGK